MSVKIALAGNPNCGKTTLFNALTGSNQFVGNWPGVTVEKKEGKLKKEANTEYSEIEMLPSDATKISRILWQKIWDKEIFIDFNKNPYSSNYPNDTVFIKY